ncbi:regulatory protein MerR [Segniliparus rotundus DSM 44985]|uniref:Regulatory protein MerR n=1 Tax=Segniliparus rotundus (strain ATCC BAA-972 / CDC 1076 / CIP 108378 / DSM 44985 / JCM 13578) TaxID=640132 RepID=D6Z9J1_SEGRD|nr:helix-turn-helix domain-containing protein [Segniliparus rotundus]ADG96518.1 regulatory protein MerR [Segniliparus rotundus DSM 44985]
MPHSEDLLSITDVVEQTGISRRTILYHIHKGRLTAEPRPSGGRGAWLIAPLELRKYLESQDQCAVKQSA